MRKKPDIVLLLSLFTIMGVLLSHFLVIQPHRFITNLTDLEASATDTQSTPVIPQKKESGINLQDVVHIDLSKQQIH